MSNLLEKLKAGALNVKVIKFPGTDNDVGLSVLMSSEIQKAVFETEKLFNARGIKYDTPTLDAYEREKTLQLLYRALRDPDNTSQRVFRNVDEFKETVTALQVDALVMEYEQQEEECSPPLDSMTEEEFEEILEEVKKRPDAVVPNISNISLLQKLVKSLASQPPISPKDSGST